MIKFLLHEDFLSLPGENAKAKTPDFLDVLCASHFEHRDVLQWLDEHRPKHVMRVSQKFLDMHRGLIVSYDGRTFNSIIVTMLRVRYYLCFENDMDGTLFRMNFDFKPWRAIREKTNVLGRNLRYCS